MFVSHTFSVRNQSCTRAVCAYFGLTAQGNVVVHARAYMRFKCTACGATWVAHRDEFYYGLRTESQKIHQAAELLAQKVSVRRVAHRLHVSPSTVQRWRTRLKNQLLLS